MTLAAQLARTPLYDWHVAHGARMVEFAGWAMPIQYSSIVDEHEATRRAMGLFDISHMGRLTVSGPAATTLLDNVLTRRVTDMRPGQARYSLICRAEGGILDDVLVYCLEQSFAGNRQGLVHQLVVNASNREKIIDWLTQQAAQQNAQITDDTASTAMIAVQGPRAIALLDAKTGGFLSSLRFYRGGPTTFAGTSCFVSRTGYTGEDGGEIVCSHQAATSIWEQLVDEADAIGGRVCGLGARDTLRLECAMPLYGHELSEDVNPIQAGLRFAVTLGEREFIGKKAIERFAADPHLAMRVGLHIEDRRVARQGANVLRESSVVGSVTSGTFSPTLRRPIAMAYIEPGAAASGTRLTVDVRGKHVPAVVVELPFYQRPD